MEQRLLKCLNAVKKSHCDCLLISNPVNITYLTGFRDADGYLLVNRSGIPVFFTNPLFAQEAHAYKGWQVRVSQGNIFSLIVQECKSLGVGSVGFESKHIPYLEYEKIKEGLLEASIDFIRTIDLLERIREIKEDREIRCIRRAAKITIDAFEFIKEIHDEAMTEKRLALEIDKFLKIKGDNWTAFDTIVASGENGAVPHYIPGQTLLNKNSFLIDLGAKHCGYCADLTRVFFWGKITPLFKEIYDLVRRAQDKAYKAIRAGKKAKDIDKAARDVIEKGGWGKNFTHGLGHGVGLQVHEAPFLNARSEEVLETGMVVTLEPAIYIPGKFGVRIEDMVLVKDTGAELLSPGFSSAY